MRNYVIINGVNSLTIQGLAINNLPPITKPMIRTQREEIDGRDGDIVTELGYSAYDKKMEIGLWGTYDINDIIKYFTGEGTIVFSNEEDKYYNFKILDQIDYEKLLKFKTATITLHCQPFKYPVEEEPAEAEMTTITGTGETITLNNTEEATMVINLKGNTSQATSILPSEYTQVDYITSSGTQYIDTGYLAKGSLKVITDIEYTSTVSGNQFIYGGRDSSEVNTNAVLFSRNDTKFRNDYNTKVVLATPNISNLVAKWHIVKDKGSLTMTSSDNQTITQTTTNATFSSSYNVYIFTCNNASNVLNPASYRLYTFKMYDNDVLVRDYVPCYRNSDNEIGLYDLVNNVFYTNAGTGAFTKGNNTSIPNPDYPQDIHVVSGENEIYISNKNLFDKDKGAWTRNYLTPTGTWGNNSSLMNTHFISVAPNTTYTWSWEWGTLADGMTWQQGMWQFCDKNKTPYIRNRGEVEHVGTKVTFTTDSNCYFIRTAFYGLKKSGSDITVDLTNHTYSDYVKNVQIEKGANKTEFIEHQGDAYPIYLGGNIFFDEIEEGSLTTQTGVNYAQNNRARTKNFTMVEDDVQFTLSCNENDVQVYVFCYGEEKNYLGVIENQWNDMPYTFTPLANTYFVRFVFKTTEGTSAPTVTNLQLYKAGATPIELCKIGNYQDSIKKSTGKNLFDKNNAEQIKNWFVSNNKIEARNGITLFFVKCEPSTQYTISKISSTRLQFWCSVEKPAIGVATSDALNNDYNFTGTTKTITTTSDAQWLICYYYNANTDTKTEEEIRNSIMLNEGTTALPYEPYGTGWYLNKQIGKVVLDGSESWLVQGSSANYYEYRLNNGVENSGTNIQNEVKTNYFNQTTNSRVMINNAKTIYLRFPTSSGIDISTLELFKTWLSTHNTIVYYVLATPTYTEITDSTLLSQLNALAKSYASQTNISQTNNDLPFELDVSATFLAPMEINNIGNIYAKPILTIEGTGNIGVVLNDIQILDIDLTNNGKIAIDVTKLEAYNPDDDTLLNRLVTGDYMKLLINEGENTITFTGDVSGATLTNYIRWI